MTYVVYLFGFHTPYLRADHAHVLFPVVPPVDVVDLARDLLEVARNVVQRLAPVGLLQDLSRLLLQEAHLLGDHGELAASHCTSELVRLEEQRIFYTVYYTLSLSISIYSSSPFSPSVFATPAPPDRIGSSFPTYPGQPEESRRARGCGQQDSLEK